MPSRAADALTQPPEDALSYLQRAKNMLMLKRGQIIYGPAYPSIGLYVVVNGLVKSFVPLDNGGRVALGIYGPDDFFGAAGLLGLDSYPEHTLALSDASAMAWSRADIEEQIDRNPRLGLALMQMAARRCVELEARIETIAHEKTPARVARAMVELAERLGNPRPDGTVQVFPLTHFVIADYVGTSREIVSEQMGRLRKAGYIDYSRHHLHVRIKALKDYLRGAKRLAHSQRTPQAQAMSSGADSRPLI